MRYRIVLLFWLAMAFATCPLAAEDWPMWRKDAGRTAATELPLPESLALKWVRHLPVISPAFHNSRLQFDAGYEPIVAGGKLLVASSRTDSVTAYDAATGAEMWSFRTNGPVRCAPAVWQDAVCFGSDDGCLYCVDLDDGQLRWEHRVVPSDRRLLGNRRLISVWPLRGGPVVADGRVYFAAGVWPFEGVFVAALDIESGDEVWRNDRLGYLFGQQPHNTEAIGGVAPQGYLLINKDELIVPCSTAYPARVNRHTGELIEFELPGPGRLPGGWFAALDETTSRAIRRGELKFDDVVNRQQHEDKVHKGRGVSGLSRRIRAGEQVLNFEDGFEGVDGTIHSMIVADNRLYVSTREGGICCFAEPGDVEKKEVRHWRDDAAELATTPKAARLATWLVQRSTGTHGYAFVIGIDDGSLVKALVNQSQYHVIALSDDSDRVARLRGELNAAEVYGTRAAVIECDLDRVNLPPYIATVMTTETPQRMAVAWLSVLQTLRPYGGIAALRSGTGQGDQRVVHIRNLEPGRFEVFDTTEGAFVQRVGPLPGATDYSGNWAANPDELVRFPLGVLWFDDTLAHFKRSPQPEFVGEVMISRPKDWHAPRGENTSSKVDYPLLPVVLSDIYTGRVFEPGEHADLRAALPTTDDEKREPSQYRPPRQSDAWKPGQPVIGERINPLTLESEPRAFPKTYGCDGGVDYGEFYTLRSGTPAFYDKTVESGTVFLSGPRSGCTNSIIPSGGLLNVPYFFEGCTCSYPLPSAFSLYAMPESYEQWSSWGATDVTSKSIRRIGLNFGAPGDRKTRDGTLWLDYPAVGGPSPQINTEISPETPDYRYRHSLWMNGTDDQPWVFASMAEGLEQLILHDLKPGRYTVRLYFAEPENFTIGQRVQTVSLQGDVVLRDFDVFAEAANSMKGITRVVKDVVVSEEGTLTLGLSASSGETIISGLELLPAE